MYAIKDAQQVVNNLKMIAEGDYANREDVIKLVLSYSINLKALRQSVKDADQYAYSRRAGTKVAEQALAKYHALWAACSEAVVLLGDILEKYDICSACYGKGHEEGWTCPHCAGSTKNNTAQECYCAGCRSAFKPNTDQQTYCVNCAHLAPNAKAAGMLENEWQAWVKLHTEPSTERPTTTQNGAQEMAEHITAERRHNPNTGKDEIVIRGPKGEFGGYAVYNGWRFGPLGVFWRDQCVDVFNQPEGTLISSFSNEGVEWAEFIYKSLTMGLVSTVYSEDSPTHSPPP